ncbi:MAG: domain S-box-containing protein [Rhizobium sp.]|nr:domain S-box-containing protein [Rhizobium sp.]
MVGLFEELANNAPVMIWRSRLDKLCDFFNQPWLEFTGRTQEQEFGNGWTERIHPEDYERCLAIYSGAFDARESFSMEYRLQRADGEYRYLLDNGAPFTRDGEFAGYFGSCIDITERKQMEDGRLVLIAELNHRVKNMLSTVQSLAHQSCGRASTPREAEELLTGRLMALSQAHEALAEQYWHGADIGNVMRRMVALASRDTDRVRISGALATLRPGIAQSLAMAIYELFLNAMQYGALSNTTGTIDIAWTQVEHYGEPWLEIAWKEEGGPPVAPPQSRGLGMRLIRSLLPLEISGETTIDFARQGVIAHIRMPIPGGMQ